MQYTKNLEVRYHADVMVIGCGHGGFEGGRRCAQSECERTAEGAGL